MKKTDQIHNNWLILSVVVAIFAIIAYFWSAFGGGSYVPKEFLEARAKGGEFGEQIVRLSGESLSNLKEIERQSSTSNYSLALKMVQEEIKRNESARNEALLLSNQLGIMASAIDDIKPKNASNLAFQAVISQSQIVQRLINYNSYIYELINLLRADIISGKNRLNESEINRLIIKMNSEITSINDLNEKYKQIMSEFDLLTL